VNWAQLCKLGTRLPGVRVDVWYRTPALKVRDKGFVRLKEDGKDVVFLLDSVDEQVALCDAKPAVYYITDHYRGHAAVLARLAKLTVAEAGVRLERSWRVKAPRQLVNDFDR